MSSQVVVFQNRDERERILLRTPPTYATPRETFHKVRLESILSLSSLPADYAKPVPLAVGSLDSE